ncbi:MAG: Holliday junction resolvase RuvX [Actinomycetota bacterium]
MKRILAVDLGTVRTGVAVASTAVAQPLDVIEETDDERIVERLADVARSEEATEIVFGLPMKLDGSDGPAATRAREIAARLEQALGVPVHLWDERLTTAQAEREMVDGGVRRKKRRASIDKIAATVLLQSYLDAQTAKGRS